MSVAAAGSVGRLLERGRSLSLLDAAAAGVRARSEGKLVWVAGEAGVGKTALLRGFCQMHDRQLRILWGACQPLRAPRPFGPLIEVAESTDGELAALTEIPGRPHEVAGALLRELRSSEPTVVVLEDLHWADEATLDVVTLLAAGIASAPVLVLASYRDDELERAPELRVVLGELVRRSERLTLEPLSATAVAALAEPHSLDAREMYERTGGNPFFVTEVLAAGGERIPETVRDAVLARAARLSKPARRLLEAVAIVPGHTELWWLEAQGELADHLDECLTSGMLAAGAAHVSFRHELARLAVEEATPPNRRLALHRGLLAALVSRECPDFARLAHHADAADDGEHVLRWATLAAERASASDAHREAAAQYERVLRFGGSLPLHQRAELLERLSEEQHVIADHDAAIASARETLDCYRKLGDRRKQADALCALAGHLYCPGEGNEEAAVYTRQAVEVLAGEPPCRELVGAYASMASMYMNSEDADGAFEWGLRAVELAEDLGERDMLVAAQNDLGTMEYLIGVPGGRERLERSLRLALEEGFDKHAARAFMHLAWVATRVRDYGRAEHYIQRGIDYCTERDLDLHRHYLFTRRAQMELGQGRWDEAAESAGIVIEDPRSAPDGLAPALAVLALVRARRGDPDHRAPLEQAMTLIDSGCDLQRSGPVVAAHAEVLWLEHQLDQLQNATSEALELMLRCRAAWLVGELGCWRWRAGAKDELPAELLAEPYRRSIAGDWAGAAKRWRELGCPYEAALALADSDHPDSLRQAFDELQALGARPAAAIVARRMRERGVRGVPRGPRPTTRENPAGLTARELEVLTLLPEGLRNAQIAERLVVSEKTVDHHVSAILRKLDVRTRGAAAAEAVRRGLTAQHG